MKVRNRAVDGIRLDIDEIIQERIDDGWRVVAMTGELDLARVLVVSEQQVGVAMRPILFLVSLVSYGIEAYHLTQHTAQSAALLLWYSLAAIAFCTWAINRDPDLAKDESAAGGAAIALWWLGYLVAWLYGWPYPSSEILIGGAVGLAMWYTVKRIGWVLP